MSEYDRFVYPFKRRRRRWSFASLGLLFFAVSSITAFVPLRLNSPPVTHRYDSFLITDPLLKTRHPRRGGRFSLLQSKANDSGDATKDESNDGKSYRIPPQQLELIKESADIVSVIESYGLPGFQRHGNNRAKAICPFHDDHNPSMSVDGQRGIYKCFACGAGGDVFNFVREYSALKSEPMTFYQAVRHVAQEFADPNLKLDVVTSSTSRMTDEERKALNEKKQRYVRLVLKRRLCFCYFCFLYSRCPPQSVAGQRCRCRFLWKVSHYRAGRWSSSFTFTRTRSFTDYSKGVCHGLCS